MRRADAAQIGTSALGQVLQNVRAIEALDDPIFAAGSRAGPRSRSIDAVGLASSLDDLADFDGPWLLA